MSLSVRVAGSTADRLRVLAAAEHRTVAAEIRRLIEVRVAEADADVRDIAA